jgi:hypothetical protein
LCEPGPKLYILKLRRFRHHVEPPQAVETEGEP